MPLYFIIAACTFSWCIAPLSLLAAGDTIVSRVLLDEVIVSAKETAPRERAPNAVTPLAAKQLERAGTRSLKQLTARVPNFYMPDYGSKLNSPLYIRGIGSRTGSPAVGLYVDGIPYLEATSFDFQLLDIERVEVFRGPQGTLYGRNTMAGIIHVITRSPWHRPGSSARLSGGLYRHAGIGATTAARVNDRVGLYAGVHHDCRGGYVTNRHDGSRPGTRDDLSARLRLQLLHGDRARSDLHVAFERARQAGYPYGKVENDAISPVDYDEPSGYDRDLLTTGYHLACSTPRVDFRLVTGYQYLDDRQAVDQDFSPASLFFAVQEQRQHALSQELVARPTRQGNYHRVSGIFAFAQWLDKEVDLFLRAAGGRSTERYAQFTRGLAAYHQSTLDNLLTGGLSLTAGIRVDREISRQEHARGGSTSTVTLRFFEILPKASLSYSRGRHSIYFSLAKGYKTGGFNATFSDESERVFHPERSWNYEIGLKSRPSRDITLDATLFYIDWRDQQITRMIVLPNNTSGSLVRNAGRSASKGLELSLGASPLPRLELDLAYGYTDARFKEYLHDPAKGTRFDGKRVPRVPSHTLSAGAAYRHPARSRWMDEVTLHARYTGTGRVFWQEDNVDRQAAHALLDAGVTLVKGRAELSLRAANILDTRYTVYRFDVAPTRSSYAQAGRPFTLDAGLRFTF
ncbi:MAG: TonB-dependent receptor [Odoribacteraceae bacterium]|jgi:outer membrane receptor protein involved in Fe transport|nr:TonB-dependent receptor [Odoribacteraceae bacterium]